MRQGAVQRIEQGQRAGLEGRRRMLPDLEAALAQAKRQAEEGADVIDVGAESARTNRAAVAVEEEVESA